MPFYYEAHFETTTNGTTATETEHLLALTAANQRLAQFRSFYVSAVFGTAGGGRLRIKTATTAGSGGAAQTPGPREPSSPAAQTVTTNSGSSFVAGTGTVTVRLGVGFAQTGGNGGWVATEQDDCFKLEPNGGAKGNLEIWSLANGVSVPIDITAGFCEG
jgi:hypothetical protein